MKWIAHNLMMIRIIVVLAIMTVMFTMVVGGVVQDYADSPRTRICPIAIKAYWDYGYVVVTWCEKRHFLAWQ